MINAILARRPETRIGVRTSAPRWLFDLTVKGKVSYSALECDTGVVQIDALNLDEADSIRRAWAFHSDLVTRAASETRVLRELGAGLIVGDIPPLAFAVGGAAGIPSVALGNFTWDWIYADYPRHRLAPSLLPTIRGAYSKTSMALRLPISGGFEVFPSVQDIPFIARHGTVPREVVCKKLRLPVDKPIVLSSFGGFGLPGFDFGPLTKLKKYSVVSAAPVQPRRTRQSPPLVQRQGSCFTVNVEAIYEAGIRYEDLVAAAAVVVTKPGYGIVSEAIANQTAILYTSRGHFPEYDLLLKEMPKYIPAAFIAQDDLFAGRWEPSLNKLLAQPKPRATVNTLGADVTAEILLKALDKPPRKSRGRPRAKKAKVAAEAQAVAEPTAPAAKPGRTAAKTESAKKTTALPSREATAKPATKKAAMKKAGGSKAAMKKAGGSKAATKKAGGSKAVTKKVGGSKAATKKAGSSKAATKKAGSSKAATKKAGGSKAATKKAAKPTAQMSHPGKKTTKRAAKRTKRAIR